MTILGQEFTAAQLTANLDVFTLEPFMYHATAKKTRRIKKVYCAGGGAVADLIFDIYYGNRLIAKNLYNVATGLTVNQSMGIPIVGGEFCKVDEKISVVITDAGNTNPYHLKFEIV